MIDGVRFDLLNPHYDERGFFCEIARVSQLAVPFAQWSHSFMHAGVVKAWHYHEQQWDLWYPVGRLKVALYDLRETSPTYTELNEFLLGDAPALLAIPPGVAHGCKALTETHLLYITSNEYDGSDELRLAHDDPGIDYDWLKGAAIT